MSDDMKRDIQKLKNDVADLRTTARQIVGTLVRMDDKLESVFRRMATKDDVSGLVARMDGFIDQLETGRYDWAKHQVRLENHEKRLARLEGRRA